MAATTSEAVIFPVFLTVNGKEYKFLVHEANIKFLSDNLETVSQQLSTMLPDKPNEVPMYLDVGKDGTLIIPDLRPITPSTPPNSLATSSTSEEATSGTCAESVDDDSDSGGTGSSSRFCWTNNKTKSLLTCLLDHKAKAKDFCLTRKVWLKIATDMQKCTKSDPPTSDQCREKFYSLKRSYMNYLSESKKTGNKRPRALMFEDEMQELLNDDPAFSPPVCKSSMGADMNNNCSRNESEEESEGNVSAKKSGKKKSSTVQELREYMKERDDRFLNAMKELQEKQTQLLERLIDKL